MGMIAFASSSHVSFNVTPSRAGCNAVYSRCCRTKFSMAADMAMASGRRNVLITFDVDGTLLGNSSSRRKLAIAAGKPPPPERVGNSAHKEAIDQAVRQVFGISGRVDDLPHAGLTDQVIVRNLCHSQGIAEDEIWKKMPEVISIASARIGGLIANDDLSPDVLPGVPALLRELRSRGAHVGLVTGNFADIGWQKMSKAGLRPYFSEHCSAFGSDATLRHDILAKASERAIAEGFSREFDDGGKCTNAFHVGDAVADMDAAKKVGARGIGVLTGSFSREQLEPLDPFVLLEDLSDTDAVLQLLGL